MLPISEIEKVIFDSPQRRCRFLLLSFPLISAMVEYQHKYYDSFTRRINMRLVWYIYSFSPPASAEGPGLWFHFTALYSAHLYHAFRNFPFENFMAIHGILWLASAPLDSIRCYCMVNRSQHDIIHSKMPIIDVGLAVVSLRYRCY